MKKTTQILIISLALASALTLVGVGFTAERADKRSLSATDMVGSAPYREAVQNYLQDKEPKVVGGKPAPPGAFPWQVSLNASRIPDQYKAHFCGGTVYSESWIVTAAHCVEGTAAKNIVVVAGTHKLGSGSGTQRDVARIIVNKKYDKQKTDNDIALIQLQEPLKLDKDVKAIPLLTAANEANVLKKGAPLVVTGWGAITEGGQQMRDLRYVEIPFVERETCNRPLAYDGRITTNMICAGVEAGGRDSCQGDSGGPLTANTGANATLVGIVSWGEGCAQPNRVGVYTRVANYADWVAGCVANPGSCE
jgi:secreted trypsin-like serine protease